MFVETCNTHIRSLNIIYGVLIDKYPLGGVLNICLCDLLLADMSLRPESDESTFKSFQASRRVSRHLTNCTSPERTSRQFPRPLQSEEKIYPKPYLHPLPALL